MGTPLNFGIEFEFVGMGSNGRNIGLRLHDAINQGRGSLPQIVFAWGDDRAHWRLKGDSSVHRTDTCTNPNRYGDGCGTCNRCQFPGGAELVSPILPYNDDGLMQVYRVCEALASCGAFTNESCGLHVHVDARWLQSHDRRFVRDFLTFMQKSYAEDEDIFDSFVHEKRRGNYNEYCQSLKNIQNYDHISRYYKLNTQAFGRHGTLEFRQHHGTIDAKEAIPWIHTCARYYMNKRMEFLCMAYENNAYASSAHRIQENFNMFV